MMNDEPRQQEQEGETHHNDQEPHFARPVVAEPKLSQSTTRAAEGQPRTIPVAARPGRSTHDSLSSTLAVAEDGRVREWEAIYLSAATTSFFNEATLTSDDLSVWADD
jgi:hypothetical protein